MDYLCSHPGYSGCCWSLLLCCLLCLLYPYGHHGVQGESSSTFRSLFIRETGVQLSARSARQIQDSSVEQCAKLCVQITEIQCKSFDFDNGVKTCLLYTVSRDDQDVHYISHISFDHYRTAYSKLFHRIPSHMLTTQHNRRVDQVSVEECARRCVLETVFKCRGFDYELRVQTCWLTTHTPDDAKGVNIMSGWDYYEKTPEGPLDRFVNFGFGHMRKLSGSEVYQLFPVGLSLEACATMCLAEQTFHCMSFDYEFAKEDAHSTCYLSKYIAANVYGLSASADRRTMHFEKKEKYLSYFYATPYAVVLGNNHKTYTRVTPNRCARMCLEEEGFICRSFDYKVEDATCLLSSKTGSDVGGLFNQGLQEVHHFEMKPILDCGGNLSNPDEGDFASPNWPRNYAHHEHCVWNIVVSRHKVIRFKFTHLDLGMRSHDPCSPKEDRVVIKEAVGIHPKSFCVLPNTKEFITLSNRATVTFSTNSYMDGQGFRVFYKAEWPCDVLMEHAPGEFASPSHPAAYPPNSRCSWRITAPQDQRIRVRFSFFQLESHALGHCNEQNDHVLILDGGTVSASKIGLYCGSQKPFTVRSTGRDLFIQFRSDGNEGRMGFMASYDFELANGTVLDSDVVAGDEYIPLETDAKHSYLGEPGVGRRYYGPDEMNPNLSHHYRTTMWAIVSTLLLIILVAAIIIYLMWHRRHRRQREEVREDMVAEIVPLQQGVSSSSPKNNDYLRCNQDQRPGRDSADISNMLNDYLHGNEIDLTTGAVGRDSAAFSNVLYGHPEKINKLKNINLDTKA